METVNPTAETQASPEQEATPKSEPVRAETPGRSEAEYEQLAKDKTELQELLQRRQAEFENYRRRVEREKKEVFEYASMDVVKSLLPILDDFERALKVESADKEYARGMELIHKRLDGLLHKLGLEPISTAGSAFNAHQHDAVDMVETDEHPDQTILDEYERGYNFKGRLLRPARVKVAVKR
jgi:molecular chaperone GrpE